MSVHALTGERLTVDDVWAVAAEGASAALADEARDKMAAAREVVVHAAHGAREHTSRDLLDRTLSPRLTEDRPLSAEIEAVATAVRDGSLVAAAEAEVGELR